MACGRAAHMSRKEQAPVSDSDMLTARIASRVRRMAGGTEELALEKEDVIMLYTIAVILLIAWLLGIVGTYTIGAFVHLLLVIAVVLFLVGVISGRRSLV